MFHAYTNTLPDSALRYVLEALIPYTQANIKLAFKPSEFFNDLEHIDRKKQYSRSSLRRAYHQAKRAGYIDTSGKTPTISAGARRMLEPYQPTRLESARLIVMFDIPEIHKTQRDKFRQLLRELRFDQVQKSVWSSEFDSRDIIRQAVVDLGIADYTVVYEAVPLN